METGRLPAVQAELEHPEASPPTLHGGGEAITMKALLQQWIKNEDTVHAVTVKAEKLGVEMAAFLEQTYGRLCEMALDLAIDRSGHIWLLEVNPKPAREVFIQAGERETYRRAIIRPLEYAIWLHEEKKRRSDKTLLLNKNSRHQNDR